MIHANQGLNPMQICHFGAISESYGEIEPEIYRKRMPQ